MTAVPERTAAVQASLFDDVVHVVDERRPAIPTRLDIAGGTDVVVGAGDMRAVRCSALGDVGRHLVSHALSAARRTSETCWRRPDAR